MELWANLFVQYCIYTWDKRQVNNNDYVTSTDDVHVLQNESFGSIALQLYSGLLFLVSLLKHDISLYFKYYDSEKSLN